MLCQYQSRARLFLRTGACCASLISQRRDETSQERNCQTGNRSRTLAHKTQKGQLPVTLFAPPILIFHDTMCRLPRRVYHSISIANRPSPSSK
jgi:hypothetical protein